MKLRMTVRYVVPPHRVTAEGDRILTGLLANTDSAIRAPAVTTDEQTGEIQVTALVRAATPARCGALLAATIETIRYGEPFSLADDARLSAALTRAYREGR